MILLDTHVLVWLAVEPKKLSRVAASAIRRHLRSGGIAIASITLWELALLLSSGRLKGPGTVEDAIQAFVQKTGATVLELTPAIAALSVQLPDDFPRDPADRLIGATSRALGVALVTADERIRRSPAVKTIW